MQVLRKKTTPFPKHSSFRPQAASILKKKTVSFALPKQTTLSASVSPFSTKSFAPVKPNLSFAPSFSKNKLPVKNITSKNPLLMASSARHFSAKPKFSTQSLTTKNFNPQSNFYQKNFLNNSIRSKLSLSPPNKNQVSLQKRSMQFSQPNVPAPYNEPMRDYAPNTEDARKLREAIDQMKKECPEVPCIVNGKELKTGNITKQLQPGNHAQALCTFHNADKDVLDQAIKGALEAKKMWEEIPWPDRAAVFLKAADLLSGKYRYQVLAATMLGQGKTVWQAEIDSTCETIDFWRWNVKYAEEVYRVQPQANTHGVWNRTEYRPLEGFVVAISPFNFTAIGANLPTSPAMMGNVVLWKPSNTAMLSNYLIFKILKEAGLPDGVINFVPGSGAMVSEHLLNHREFSGLHFTGSTEVFNGLMFKTAQNLNNRVYRGYPRIVGETGGKDFHIAHPNCDIDNLVNCTVRGAFEYQGQKCSATSRAYIPKSIWPEVKEKMCKVQSQIKVSEPDDWKAFMGPVIDKKAFDRITDYIKYAKEAKDAEIIAGGTFDDAKGYFIQPTIIVTTNPKFKSMEEEIFGPVLTVYVYEDDKFEETIQLCDETSPYALTGSIFANDRRDIARASQLLRHTAGNFYINDKSTGAVVGQQPFGGARASGTNDKAGAAMNLMRWVSARSIKENLVPLYKWDYPHMQ